MANYSTRLNIELVHGPGNIRKWADLDNDKNTTTINNRINWAAEIATEYMNGRLIMGRYDLPFEDDGVPKMVIFLSSLLSGIILYDGRTVVAGSPRDEVLHKRKEFKRVLREILCGQLKLTHPTTGELIESDCETAPVVVSSTTNLFVDLVFQPFYFPFRTNCIPWCDQCCCHTCICRSIALPTW